ncbi:ankyrin repeat-containing domain protein [Xylaria grammica]|nr:ankyrin repeat-containing domain protein [Xylaria grammica]
MVPTQHTVIGKLANLDKTSFFEAVEYCKEHHDANSIAVQAVKALIDCGTDATVRAKGGNDSVLHIAARNGCAAAVELFKHSQPMTEARDRNDCTPLHIAASHGRDAVARILLGQFSADIEAKTGRNWTPLHFAARSGSRKVVSLLIQSGADVVAETAHRYTPVYLACFSEHDELAATILNSMTREQALEVSNADDDTLLWVAMSHNCFQVVRKLVSYVGTDATILSESSHGWTPFLCALSWNSLDTAKLLIKHGASIKGTDVEGNTALHLRVARVDTDSWTALHWAAWYERLDLIRLLITHHADLSVMDDMGRTPFDIAQTVGTNSIEILEWPTLADVHDAHTSHPPLERPTLKPQARELCMDFYTYLMDFYLHSEMEKSRFTVHNVIYEYGPKPLMTTAADARGIQEPLRFRWIHLPMNSKIWIEDLLQSIYFDQKQGVLKRGGSHEARSVDTSSRRSNPDIEPSALIPNGGNKANPRDETTPLTQQRVNGLHRASSSPRQGTASDQDLT